MIPDDAVSPSHIERIDDKLVRPERTEYAVVPSMPTDEQESTARFSPEGARLLVIVIGVSCASVILYSPQAIPPSSTPPLVLGLSDVEEVRLADASSEEQVPRSETVLRLERVYAAAGFAELGEPEETEAHPRRMAELAAGIEELEREAGAEAVNALRARTATRGYLALLGQSSTEERRGLLGNFAEILERYSVVSQHRLVAPEIVFRSLYKARWNGYMGRALTDGLSPIELQAYWGWLALHAHDIEVRRRLHALERYEEASGERLVEARAALLFQAGAYPESSDIYDSLFQDTGSIRYRNHALAAVSAAQ